MSQVSRRSQSWNGFALKGDRERGLEAGMDGYVPKPIRLTELLKALQSVVPDLAGLPAPTEDEVASPGSLDMTAALDGVMGDWGG
jgi:DNA-binding response OmpR family regulator